MPRYFRHYKTGNLYELLHIARIEADPDKKAVVYQAMYGAGRFVIGLAADIKILQGKKLLEYIREYDKKHIQRL